MTITTRTIPEDQTTGNIIGHSGKRQLPPSPSPDFIGREDSRTPPTGDQRTKASAGLCLKA